MNIEPTCVLCPVYYPEAKPHAPNLSQTCSAGRTRLSYDLLSIESQYLRLIEREREIVDQKNPISTLLPMAPIPARSTQPSVSGSRERQLIIDITRFDLIDRARPWVVTDSYGDQIGALSVATRLYRWADFWRVHLYGSTVAPPTGTLGLLNWITVRLNTLFEYEQELAQFASLLIEIRNQLRNALGESPPKPVVMKGVPCPRCDTMSSLVLDPEDENKYRECTAPGCSLLLSDLEYREHLMALIDAARPNRNRGVVQRVGV